MWPAPNKINEMGDRGGTERKEGPRRKSGGVGVGGTSLPGRRDHGG